jgi:hypothetical protein
LRSLLFDRDRRVRNETVELVYRRSIPGASLAILALLAVEDEAQRTGFSDSQGLSRFADSALVRLRDRTLGDLLAARLEKSDGMGGGLNAAYLLNYLAENHRETRLTSEKAPTDAEKTAVLAAWKAFRVANPLPAGQKPVTTEQFDAEVQLARRAVYGDFKVTPDWAKIVTAMQSLGTNYWPNEADPNRKTLETLAPAARPDVLRALRWKAGPNFGRLENAPSLRAIATITEPLARGAAFDYLLARAYDGTLAKSSFYVDDDTKYLAPILLGQMDFERAKPHLEHFILLKAPREIHLKRGAAVALMEGGDKRAVPIFFAVEAEKNFFEFEDAARVLPQITGQTFANRYAWQKWWGETGSKQEWK